MRGLYLHWPYCRAICPYCDFNVYRARSHDGALFDAILADIAGWAALMGKGALSSVYLGGGTPSLMAPEQIEQLIGEASAQFGLQNGAEITLELNPEDASPDALAGFVEGGVTRFSIGAQSLDDDALKALGRWHSAEDTRRAIEQAAATGVRVSADFIYGRSGQRLEDWDRELDQILAMPLEHLSLYQLTIETGTAFEKRAARGLLNLPDDDVSAEFFDLTRQRARASGFFPYEISNFARHQAAQSAHNLVYWRGGDWAGVGPGAHGRYTDPDGQRFASAAHRKPRDYQSAVSAYGLGISDQTALTPGETFEEGLMMGMRLEEGMAFAEQPAAAATLIGQGFLAWEGGRLLVPQTHRALTDAIARELLVQWAESEAGPSSPASISTT
jgi:putative oxygen-independent coproporphyrinogen III oxidase